MKNNEFGQRWALWKWFRITSKEGEPYLTRLRLVQTPWLGVYVHRIYREDFDRHPHDHPWQFLSFVLSGGYVEQTYEADATVDDGRYTAPSIPPVAVVRRRWSLHAHRYSRAHQITYVKPGTRTLVIVGPRRGGWGFWTEEGWRPWREYLAEQGHPQAAD